MICFAVGTLLLVVPGVWAAVRAPGELRRTGRIGRATFLGGFISFAGIGLSIVAAAITGEWPLPLTPTVGWVAGAAAAAFGAFVYLAGRVRFRSFKRAWGLTNDQLVTGGIYRFTRNPQVVGFLFMYIGAALAGASGSALALTAEYLVSLMIWLPFEEKILEGQYGEAYRAYRAAVPRFFGLPRKGAPASAATIAEARGPEVVVPEVRTRRPERARVS